MTPILERRGLQGLCVATECSPPPTHDGDGGLGTGAGASDRTSGSSVSPIHLRTYVPEPSGKDATPSLLDRLLNTTVCLSDQGPIIGSIQGCEGTDEAHYLDFCLHRVEEAVQELKSWLQHLKPAFEV